MMLAALAATGAVVGVAAPTERPLNTQKAIGGPVVLGDVTVYGADPAPGNDDTAALQRALSNCSHTNGQVYFPPGTYTVSRPVPAGWHPQMGAELNAQSIPLLPVPSHCIVFGVGSSSVVRFADSVNRAAFFRMFGTCSDHADGCGRCYNATASKPRPRGGVPAADCNGQVGKNGPPGRDWPNCNFTCPRARSVQNVTIRDLKLWGSTNYTSYYPTPTSPRGTAGFREHGAAVYFYQGDSSQPPIRDITVQRLTVGGFAGDALDFGGGVHNLLVEDILLTDYLRQGVDFAGGLANGDQPSRNFTARRVRDLAFTPGVTAGGSTIHVEEAGGLRDVYIYDNVCNHSILASGPTGMWITGNVVEGQILCNLDQQLTIANNLILTRQPSSPNSSGCGGDVRAAALTPLHRRRPAAAVPGFGSGQSTALIASDFSAGVTIQNNTLVHRSDCDPRWAGQLGIQLLGGVEHYPMMRDVLIQGNRFRIEGSTATATLIDVDGCEGLIVRGNDYGSAGGSATAHIKEGRCTNCTVDPDTPPAHQPASLPPPTPMPTPPALPASQPLSPICAGDVTLSHFGAVPDDGRDDTSAIQAALNSCGRVGGVICVPAGTYTISLPPRPNETDLCLAVPSHCTLRGAGTSATTLKFAQEVNVQGWWRMLGPAFDAGTNSASNITITDLTLDGSTNHTVYPCTIPRPGMPKGDPVCEHNALIFFYTKAPGVLRDITVRRVVAEAIAGDCMDFGDGVQNLDVADIQIRDYLRQGVDLAGNSLSWNHTVRNVTELTWQVVVKPGGSTIHIEEATGLHDVVLENSVCNHSLLASQVTNLTIRGNVIHGKIEANDNRQLRIERNTVIATERSGSLASFLSAQHATLGGNRFEAAGPELSGAQGVYFWGHDEGYRPSADITIAGNTFVGAFATVGRALQLYGVSDVEVSGNLFEGSVHGPSAKNNTCECCRVPSKIESLCVNVTVVD
jgi:hypothetical protein